MGRHALISKCHPDRPHKALGLCKNCYKKALYKRNPEKQREISRRNLKRRMLENLSEVRHKARERHLKKTYGLTLEDFDRMKAQQSDQCKICGGPPTGRGEFHVDHKHGTNIIRGLLCNSCNGALGWYENNKEAIEVYLK